MGDLLVIGREEVRRHLTYEICIPLVREAMIALSSGRTRQLLRAIVDLEAGRAFGVMPGSMGPGEVFGAKLISVFPENFEKAIQSHQGVVTIFDPETGAPAAVVHAGEITAIRTAAATAAATDVLARPGPSRLAILGYGEQAETHLAAIAQVRELSEVTVWGRSFERAQAFAKRHAGTFPIRAVAMAREAVAQADIVCTVTAFATPVLLGAWLAPGTHVNLVGSSRPGPVEVDDDLVVRARLFADHLESVLKQGAEILHAKAAGLIDDDHVLGEIGQVMDGTLPGRVSPDDLTVYKSLGSIVQDLASAWALHGLAMKHGFGTRVPF